MKSLYTSDQLPRLKAVETACFNSLAGRNPDAGLYLLKALVGCGDIGRWHVGLCTKGDIPTSGVRIAATLGVGEVLNALLAFCIVEGMGFPGLVQDESLAPDFLRDHVIATERQGFPLMQMMSRLVVSHFYKAQARELRQLVYGIIGSLHIFVLEFIDSEKGVLEYMLPDGPAPDDGMTSRPGCMFHHCRFPAQCGVQCQCPASLR